MPTGRRLPQHEHRTSAVRPGVLGPEIDPVRFLADRYAELAADGVVELRRALELIAFAHVRSSIARPAKTALVS